MQEPIVQSSVVYFPPVADPENKDVIMISAIRNAVIFVSSSFVSLE